MHLEETPRKPDGIDNVTLFVINLLLALILSALVFGPKVIFFTALILVPCAIMMMVALTRGFGQPPL